MRRALGIVVAVALPVVALAQPAPITATPLLPSVQYPGASQPSPPVQPQAEQPKAEAAPLQPNTGPSQPQPLQLTWVPQGSALLRVLDKVNAISSMLTVKVGQQAQYGSLTIQVQACDIHPPDQPQDFAAYLTITDSRVEAPGFRGWMLADDPSVSMLQHPIYDVRVVGCQA